MTILHIETSTHVCSVALSYNGECVFVKQHSEGMNHAVMLSPFIDEALNFAKLKQLTLEAVAVSEGPGSYTGLRIGVSTAKGLCYGLEIPLIAVDTLEIITEAALETVNESTNKSLFCPMIDARRMEVYACIFNSVLKKQTETEAKIIDENSFSEELKNTKIYFFGNGAAKCKDVIYSENAIFWDNIHPHAKHMIRIAEKAFLNKNFVDLAYFEPFYLKEFQTTTPKKQIS